MIPHNTNYILCEYVNYSTKKTLNNISYKLDTNILQVILKNYLS